MPARASAVGAASSWQQAAEAFEAGDFSKLFALAEFTVERGSPPEFTASRENGHRRPRGYADWRPQAKTRALLADVEAVLEEYEEHLPLTVRQVFYRLVATALYEKTENAYNRLAEALVRARRAKLIPFDAIRDDGVVTITSDYYAGIEAFHDETARRARAYRVDRQAGQPLETPSARSPRRTTTSIRFDMVLPAPGLPGTGSSRAARGSPGRQLKADTLHSYRLALKRFIEDFEEIAITGVSREQAFAWALDNRWRVQFVTALYSHARDIGLVQANPFEGLRLERSEGRRSHVPLGEEELHELGAAAATTGAWGPTFRGLILFLAYTGMRPGEVFALRRRDIDPREKTIRVRARVGRGGEEDLPKSNRVRTILLPPPAGAALASMPRYMDLVFRGAHGKPLRRSSVAYHWRKLGTGLDLYDLRHFAAHHMYVTLGVPARVVAVQLGHRDGGRLVETLYGHGDHGALDELRAAWTHAGHTHRPEMRSMQGNAKA
jgi:integrase